MSILHVAAPGPFSVPQALLGAGDECGVWANWIIYTICEHTLLICRG